MLFGETPFFGLTMPELIKDIRAKVDNLKFPKEISEDSKDLIRRLLKTNPKERMDWNEFFNHSLFEVKEKSGINDLYSQIGMMLIEGETQQVDSEFQKNKTEPDLEEQFQFMDQDKLIEYG